MEDKYESETLALRHYCSNKNVTCSLRKKVNLMIMSFCSLQGFNVIHVIMRRQYTSKNQSTGYMTSLALLANLILISVMKFL